MGIFNLKATNHKQAKMFLDPNGGPKIARYDDVKYPQLENYTEKQLSFFWRPEEVDLSRDKNDFQMLSPHEKHIFTSNLKRQIVLDSVQGRGPNRALLPICSLPELEVWIETWGANETIHSRSYTHIIRNIYPDPSKIFDDLTEIEEIVNCATDITKYYDELENWNSLRAVWQNKSWFGKFIDFTTSKQYSEYEHKKALWMTLNSINALEGLRFYVSFACSWNFAEQKKMEGNAKEIKLIARDENLHLGSTQYILRTLPKDDPDFEKIKKEKAKEVTQLFHDVRRQEKEWAKYLFKDGSMIGLTEEILCQYVDYMASRRMRTLGLEVDFDHPTSDPLPWTKTWISGKEVQVAPQEAEISSYLTSDVKQDVNSDVLGELSL